MKECTKCNLNKNVEDFYIYKGVPKSMCKACDNKRRKLHGQKAAKQNGWPKKSAKSLKKQNERSKVIRKTNIPKAIYKDSRNSDNKKGLNNDLTEDFIGQKISKGCSYCGETKLRMTLDRIDNAKGHTKDNVISACIRCNNMRGSMPYNAWMHIVPLVKEAKHLELFGDWIPGPKRLKAGQADLETAADSKSAE